LRLPDAGSGNSIPFFPIINGCLLISYVPIRFPGPVPHVLDFPTAVGMICLAENATGLT